MKCSKSYLIICTHGKRHVMNLDDFDYTQNNTSKEVILYACFRKSSHFNMLGKNKVKGKRAWNEFLRGLKI